MINVANAKDWTLPLQGTDVAVYWDDFYHFLVGISFVFFMIVVLAMIFFAVKYRDRSGRKATQIEGNHPLEIAWTVIPTLLLMVIFAWGWNVYVKMVSPPADAMEIKVIGKQWLWQFQYDDGRTLTGELFVPVNQPIKLITTSEDVLHSFFIPNFRVKQDTVPGRYTTLWFEPKVIGKHQVYCAEYCGATHSGMLADIYVLDESMWKKFKRGKKIEFNKEGQFEVVDENHASLSIASLSDQGHQVMKKNGCFACHSIDGSSKLAPSFKGTFGSEKVLEDGTKVVVNEDFIRESIVRPQAKVAKGFSDKAVMPTFQGLIKETEMNAIIAYLKELE